MWRRCDDEEQDKNKNGNEAGNENEKNVRER